jgi:3-deoxy-manno-octulosonate cytidylyltransferase (CMP-KDO synthetase)
MNIAIAIPARYASTRFPGKPLEEIAGRSMIGRVMDLAQNIVNTNDNVSYFVTTDDKRIADHVLGIGAACIMTPASVPTGSDRVLSALRQFDDWPDFVLNLQGDAPFTPPHVVQAMIDTFKDNPRAEVITPVHRLSWGDLDRLREIKKTTPFSGTTAIVNDDNRALWFSKNIIPAMRKEDAMRASDALSPIHQHMGLYGFRTDILEKFCALPQGTYEQLEGLEQLRMIENGIKIQAVPVEIETGNIQSGIDTPEDLTRAEAFLKART